MRVSLSNLARSDIEILLDELLGSLDAYDARGRVKASAIKGVKFSDFTKDRRRELSEKTYRERAERVIGELVDFSVAQTKNVAEAVVKHKQKFGFYQGVNVSWGYTPYEEAQLKKRLEAGNKLEQDISTIAQKNIQSALKRRQLTEAEAQIYGKGYKYSKALKRKIKKADIYDSNQQTRVFRSGEAVAKEYKLYGAVSNLYSTAYNAGGHWRDFAEAIKIFHPSVILQIWNSNTKSVFNVVFDSSDGQGNITSGSNGAADAAIVLMHQLLSPNEAARFKKAINSRGNNVI